MDAQLLAILSHSGQALLEHFGCASWVAFGAGNVTQAEEHEGDKAWKFERAYRARLSVSRRFASA
jgi:hypothetical protein